MDINAYKSTMDRIADALGGDSTDPSVDVLSRIESGAKNSGSLLGVYKTMTATEFDAFLEESGWHKGTWKYTADGTEYTLGTDNSFGLFNYPSNVFNSVRYIHIIPDGKSAVRFSGQPTVISGKMNYTWVMILTETSKDEIYCTLGKDWMVLMKISPLSVNESPSYLIWTTCQKSGMSHNQGMDIKSRVAITNDAIEISLGDYYSVNTSSNPNRKAQPRIRLGETILTEEKLTALLALLN